jgi:DNA polymerase-3 subunit beta
MEYFLHLTEAQDRNFLTGVATDSHRLSSSSLEIEKVKFSFINFTKKNSFSTLFLLQRQSKNYNANK